MTWLRNRHGRWIGIVAAMFALGLTGLVGAIQAVEGSRSELNMTDATKTVCVGRFLVDLPGDALVSFGTGYTGGFHLSSIASETDEEFSVRIKEMGEEVTARRDEGGRPYLQSATEFTHGAAQGKVFVYNRRRGETLVNSEVVELEDVSVRGMLRAQGMSIIGSAEYMALDVGERMERLLRQVRPLVRNEIPREKGFCIDHAIVTDPFEDADTKKVVMFAGLPGHPDINLVLSSMAGTDPAPGLRERHTTSAKRLPLFVRMASTDLRNRERIVNGLRGDEVIMRVREANFTTGYSFRWEMAGRRDDVHAPRLSLELESGTNPVAGGGPVPSSLSEKDMFHLWERVASSIRVRPTPPSETPIMVR